MTDIVERLRRYIMPSGNIKQEAADEITRLRAELAAVTEERDRMRTRLDKAHGFISRADWAQFFQEEHEDARAALEGVTEPVSHKGPDEHLNLRNAECLPSTAAIMKPEPPR